MIISGSGRELALIIIGLVAIGWMLGQHDIPEALDTLLMFLVLLVSLPMFIGSVTRWRSKHRGGPAELSEFPPGPERSGRG